MVQLNPHEDFLVVYILADNKESLVESSLKSLRYASTVGNNMENAYNLIVSMGLK